MREIKTYLYETGTCSDCLNSLAQGSKPLQFTIQEFPFTTDEINSALPSTLTYNPTNQEFLYNP